MADPEADGEHGGETAAGSRGAGEAGRPTLVGVYLRGICMGAADAVPGVSGGTIALVTGIYERLIAAVTAVSPGRVLDVLAAPLPGRRRQGLAALRAMDAAFLATLLAGILTAVVAVTRLLEYALSSHPVVTFGLFFGLIGASALVLFGAVSLDSPTQVGVAVAGFVVAFVASKQASAALGTGPATTFLAGAVAVSAMVLPGISGSLLLIILGQYRRMIGTLQRFVDALVALPRDGAAPLLDPGATVTAFVLGGVAGLLTVAHAVRWALARRREATMAFLVSLVLGALRAPVVRTAERLPGGWTTDHVAAFALAALVGAVAVALIDRVT